MLNNKALKGMLEGMIAGAPEGTTQVIGGGVAMTISKFAGLPPVVSFPRDAVLDVAHLAVAFRVGLGAVKKMDLPVYWIGAQAKYIWGVVLDHIAEKARESAA